MNMNAFRQWLAIFLSSMFAVAVLASVPLRCHAHEGEAPPSSTPEADAVMQACQIFAARAAWGAHAAFKGAPSTFKYVPLEQLKEMAHDDTVPADAIYVGLWGDENDNDLEARKNYEQAAFTGWKQGKAWMKEGKADPGPHMLMAIFYNGCKESLKEASK